MKSTSTSRGFTLIELLVVIAIIALLSSVVLASLGTARAKSRDARRLADNKQIMTALEMYFDDFGSYPAAGVGTTSNAAFYGARTHTRSIDSGWTVLETLLKPYIAKLPVDPLNSGPPYIYHYTPEGHSYCSQTPRLTLVVSMEATKLNLPLYIDGSSSTNRYCMME